MISIIIASANQRYLNNVKLNIANTIGVEHEIISFKNNTNPKGICEIYNIGVERAQYDIICFMHEDIEIETPEWGKKVTSIMIETPELGVLGIAGSTYKSVTPSIWCPPLEIVDESSWRIRINQGYKFDKKEDRYYYHNPLNERLSKVACIDGVWFCTRKKIALENKFDELLLKGFHGYDTDFCLQVQQHHDLYICYDILINHYSEGRFDDKWIIETLKVHKKWSAHLPVNYGHHSLPDILKNDKMLLIGMMKSIVKNKKITFPLISSYLFRIYRNKFISFRLYLKLLLKSIKYRTIQIDTEIK